VLLRDLKQLSRVVKVSSVKINPNLNDELKSVTISLKSNIRTNTNKQIQQSYGGHNLSVIIVIISQGQGPKCESQKQFKISSHHQITSQRAERATSKWKEPQTNSDKSRWFQECAAPQLQFMWLTLKN